MTASERDLRALAAIVSEDRSHLPDGEGLPPSLLADLMDQIRCDQVVFLGFDGSRQGSWWFTQEDPFKVPFTDHARMGGLSPDILGALREKPVQQLP